ncbi:MAG: hypothetical protein WB615_03925 [Candidatus Tumulicola sp.]
MSSRASASLVVALLATVIASRAGAHAGSAGRGQTWLVASDIHLDPLDRRRDPSLFGSDTNLTLFRSALSEMKRAVPNPAVVLLPGDFFAHDFARVVRRHGDGSSADDEGVRTMRSIATAFARAFPHARFALALGNNDTPCGDYRTEFGTPYMAAVARAWAPLVNRNGAAPGFAASFARSGHYTMLLPVRHLQLVVIDDVPLAALYLGNCATFRSNGVENELSWLQTALSGAPPGMRSVVMMHIPPGYDAMATEETRGFVPWPFLETTADVALLSILSAPSNRVAYALAGHAHRFDFRLDGGVPIFVFGSISPIYHNNPTFYALDVGSDGSLRDARIYAFDEWTQAWQPPRSFDAKWRETNLGAAALARIHARLGDDAAMRRAWDAASSGWPSNWHNAWGLWGVSWRTPWCAQTNLATGFAGCAGLTGRVTLLRIALMLAVAGAVALAVRLAQSHC